MVSPSITYYNTSQRFKRAWARRERVMSYLSSISHVQHLIHCPVSEVVALQDSGGYTKSGELPSADCIHLHSERELKQELDSVLKKLAPNAEWTTRIQVALAAPGRVMIG